MNDNNYLGIDNGKSGWLVVISDNKIIDKMPNGNALSMYEFIKSYNITYAAAETVVIKRGFRHVISTGFIILGKCIALLEMLDIPYVIADPRLGGWRKQLGYTSTGRDNLKQESISKVVELFDNGDNEITRVRGCRQDGHIVKVQYKDDNIADSIMLAEYAKFIHTNGVDQ